MDGENNSTVELWIYDLSNGMAMALSPIILGKQLEGIWHTSIVVYGKEFFFGSQGVSCCEPGATILGQPLKIEKLGETQVPYNVYIEYINGLNGSSFHATSYNLLTHNCNNFSNELAQFLCGKQIPSYILDLPNEIINTPIGQQFIPLFESIQASLSVSSISQINGSTTNRRSTSPDLQVLNQQIEEARLKSIQLEERRNQINEKIAKRERKKEKKRLKQLKSYGYSIDETTKFVKGKNHILKRAMTDSVVAENGNLSNEENGEIDISPKEKNTIASDIALELEREERREAEEKKRQRDPPIVFKDLLNIQVEFDELVGLIDGKLNEDEQRSLEELHQYMIEDEGSWALGENFLNFIGRLLHDKSLDPKIRVKTLNVLALAALKDDVILLLHQDRREHIIMNYAYDIDRHTVEEQESLALLICNLFENLNSSEWLMYISEWAFCNQQISNIRVSTKVAVHSLLSDVPTLKERGVAIMYNLACKEVKTVVFDDVAVELTMALLQYFQSKPNEEDLYRCMKSLARLTSVSSQEVTQLIQMIGPDPNSFRGVSDRVDEQIDLIGKKLR